MTNPSHIVSENIAPYAPGAGTRAVKLFRNGANQAVRIPKEFELPGVDALIHREGDKLIIEPAPSRPKKGTVAALMLALEEIRALGPCTDEEALPDVDEGLLPADDIVL